jgi:hypothetical protein
VAEETTAQETYEVPGTRGSAVDFCVDRLIEGCQEGGRLAVADKAAAPENYEIPVTRGSAVNFCVWTG